MRIKIKMVSVAIVLAMALSFVLIFALTGCQPKPAEKAAPAESAAGTETAPVANQVTIQIQTASEAFAGVEACKTCHPGRVDQWSKTGHAKAETALTGGEEPAQDVCFPCHTVGYDPNTAGGYDDIESKTALGGVQCENCHGSAIEHIKSPGTVKPAVIVTGEQCMTCHTDVHHPTTDEWKDSKHAVALDGLKSSDHAADYCLECHTTDDLINPAVKLDEAQTSITCVKCHNPHGTENTAQLREPVGELCGSCHTMEGAKPGSAVHHATAEMFSGTGAAGEVESVNTHAGLQDSCATCHMVKKDYESEEAPAVTGHTFMPNFEACTTCHGEDGQKIAEETQAEIKAKADEIQKKIDAIDPKGLTTVAAKAAYDIAKFNLGIVLNDGSMGVHNKPYAEALLAEADAQLANLK
ncbi:MAG: hypothetical protein M1371_11180 [Actinobacteria bacterium]|nr:hypothetical protein [Actinomycetota bacterium]